MPDSMSHSPKVSVCLPLYNGAKHLSAAIESVLSQSLEDFELLIADDGSADGSEQIAAEYAAKDKRISYWKNETRQGLFGNYNACLLKAKGSYIKTFAQDDLLATDCLASFLQVLEGDQSVALVSSARRIIDGAGREVELKQPFPRDIRLDGKNVVRFNLIGLNNWVGEPSTVMFRTAHAGTGFDTGYFHYGDIEYWFRILSNGDLQYLAEPKASFRRHEDSQTDKNHRKMLFALDIVKMSFAYKSILSEFEPDELFQRRIAEKIALEHGHTVADVGAEALMKEYAAESGDAAGFRLLSSMALGTISDLIKELDHEKRCRHDEHERFVVEVNKMKNSVYYKLGNPLRKIRNVIKGDSHES